MAEDPCKSVRESTAFVAREAAHVTISGEAIESAAEGLSPPDVEKLWTPDFDAQIHFKVPSQNYLPHMMLV